MDGWGKGLIGEEAEGDVWPRQLPVLGGLKEAEKDDEEEIVLEFVCMHGECRIQFERFLRSLRP